MTLLKYLNDASVTGRARVTDTGTDDRGPYVELDETIFHRQGGGQAADRGRIDDKVVVGVRNVDGQTRHYIEDPSGLAIRETVDLEVDREWRDLCSKYHTGGHLIAGLVEQRYAGARAVGGHHWAGEARVEFVDIETGDLLNLRSQIQADIDEVTTQQRIVVIETDDRGTRTCRIGGLPAIPCGGTHVTCTSELRGLTISGVTVKRENVRVSYTLPS